MIRNKWSRAVIFAGWVCLTAGAPICCSSSLESAVAFSETSYEENLQSVHKNRHTETLRGRVRLVSHGKAEAVVVTADTPTRTAKYAAAELVTHVEKATGVLLPVVRESKIPEKAHSRIYIGETAAAARMRNPIRADQLPRETAVLRSVGNDLFILGREDDRDPLSQSNENVGTLFGVYEFLEKVVGVRWLWPGDLGTFVPQTDELSVTSVNEMITPALQFRRVRWRLREFDRLSFSPEGVRQYGEELNVFYRRHRMGGIDAKPRAGHFFEDFYAKYGRDHPEWFMLRWDGTRGHPDPDFSSALPVCVSNEELHDYIFELWDGESDIPLTPVDRPGRCTCEHCRAWDGPPHEDDDIPWFAEMTYRTIRWARHIDAFSGVTSDRRARFWKNIQKRATETNPEVLVTTYLYENEFVAPVTGIQLNRNIYGEFVPWLDPHLRYFPTHEKALEWLKEQWLGWYETGIRMAYRPNYLLDGYAMPHFDTRQSYDFFRFAYKYGMEGADFDSNTGQWAAQGPKLYLHMRLLSDPTLSLETIRREYFSAFGPAEKYVEQYFDYWENYSYENKKFFFELFEDVGWRWSRYPLKAHVAFPHEVFEPAQNMLDQALTAARQHPQPEFSERVEFLRTGLEHVRLTVRFVALFDGRENIPDEKIEEAVAILSQLIRFRQKHEHLYISDYSHLARFEFNRFNFDPLFELLE